QRERDAHVRDGDVVVARGDGSRGVLDGGAGAVRRLARIRSTTMTTTMTATHTHSFRALFERPADLKSGGYVKVPFDVEGAFGKKRPAVVVTLGATRYRSTVAVYGGESFVVVREEIRKLANVN